MADLAGSFERAAALYHRARPEYPDALFDELTAATGLRPGDQLLEVGCATGKATLPLARCGYRIMCVEPGHELAEAARRNTAGLQVEVIESRFEDWQARQPFDLVFAATAWHWIDPKLKYRKAWSVLRPGGHLVFWSATHVFPENGDQFFRDIQDVYDEIGQSRPSDTRWPKPGQLPDQRAEIEASGLFQVVRIRQFDWERTYDPDGYIELLETFSDHVAMAAWQRERLFNEIWRRLAERPDHAVRRHWGAVLHVARRLEKAGADASH